jgi:hypothetical protein
LFEDRFDSRLDDNNYYEQEMLVLPKGRLIDWKLDSDFDWEEDDPDWEEGWDWEGEWNRVIWRIPQEKRYQWARLYALKCIAKDLKLDPEREPRDFDALMAQIMAELPPRLAALWAKGALPSDEFDGDNRERWGRQMELLIQSIRWHEPPFAGLGSPYEYRAFDLAWDDDDKAHHAILLVDIHT